MPSDFEHLPLVVGSRPWRKVEDDSFVCLTSMCACASVGFIAGHQNSDSCEQPDARGGAKRTRGGMERDLGVLPR